MFIFFSYRHHNIINEFRFQENGVRKRFINLIIARQNLEIWTRLENEFNTCGLYPNFHIENKECSITQTENKAHLVTRTENKTPQTARPVIPSITRFYKSGWCAVNANHIISSFKSSVDQFTYIYLKTVLLHMKFYHGKLTARTTQTQVVVLYFWLVRSSN